MAMPQDRSENPRAVILIRHQWGAWTQAMRMARNLLKAERPVDFHDQENADRYYSFIPLIASSIVRDILQDAAFLKQAPENMQEDRISSMGAFIKELAAFNDEQEKERV
jgi:hypothetical protein